MKGGITTVDGTKVSVEMSPEEAVALVSAITPEAIKDLMGMLSDRVKGWRMNQWIAIAARTQRKIRESGLNLQHVAPKILLPLIEDSSLETDENLQDMWENLLANAATGKVEVSPNYVQVLKELSPLEARILNQYFENEIKRGYRLTITEYGIRRDFEIDNEKAELILDNFLKLKIIREQDNRDTFPASYRVGDVGDFFGSSQFGSQEYPVKKGAMEELLETIKGMSKTLNKIGEKNDKYEFSPLGKHFLKACKWNSKQA